MTRPINLPMPRMMIETTYRGPTDHHGTRTVARWVNDHRARVSIPWDHALGAPKNHFLAAMALAVRRGRVPGRPRAMCSVDGGGYVFAW